MLENDEMQLQTYIDFIWVQDVFSIIVWTQKVELDENDDIDTEATVKLGLLVVALDETEQIDDKWLLHIAKWLKKVVLM